MPNIRTSSILPEIPLEIAEANLRKAKGKRQKIEANLALRRARTRVETINEISELVGVSE